MASSFTLVHGYNRNYLLDMSTYNIEHIKEAFSAARRGLTEAAFLAYLEVRTALSGEEPIKAKRGRKPAAVAKSVKAAKPAKKRKGKRVAVGAKVLEYVSSKGKAGAHVNDISSATGIPKANVTAYFYSKAGKSKTKNLGKATFAIK